MVALITATVLLAQQAAKNLAVETWDFVEVMGKPVPASMKRPSLEFMVEENKVVGNAGVNRFSGTATFKGSKVTFGEVVSTLMAGSPEAMELEASVHKVFQATDHWRLKKGYLELLHGRKRVAKLMRHREK